jgi:quinol monooxygenase YgiN
MTDILVMEFDAPQAQEIYHSVNRMLGMDDQAAAQMDWPDGMLSHVAAESGDRLLVVEEWESQAAQDAFMQSRLGPAFEKASVPPPTRVEWLNQLGGMHRD